MLAHCARVAAIGALVAIPVAASCGGGGGEDHSGLIADLAAQAPPEQREAFADGRIDFAEYEAAVDRTVACIEDLGYGSTKRQNSLGMFSLTVDGVESSAKSDEVYNGCSDKFKTQIEVAYSRLNPPELDPTSGTDRDE